MQRSWHRSCAPTKGCLTPADDSIPNNITSNIHFCLLTSDSWSLPPDVPGQTDEPTISRISPVFCSFFVHGTKKAPVRCCLQQCCSISSSGLQAFQAWQVASLIGKTCRLYVYHQLMATNQVFESASVEIMMITSVYLFVCI